MPEPAVWCLSLSEPLKDRKKCCTPTGVIFLKNHTFWCVISKSIFTVKVTRSNILIQLWFKNNFLRLSIMWTMKKCEPGESVNHGKKLKSVNQNHVNHFFSEPCILVHIMDKHLNFSYFEIIKIHESLRWINFYFQKSLPITPCKINLNNILIWSISFFSFYYFTILKIHCFFYLMCLEYSAFVTCYKARDFDFLPELDIKINTNQ